MECRATPQQAVHEITKVLRVARLVLHEASSAFRFRSNFMQSKSFANARLTRDKARTASLVVVLLYRTSLTTLTRSSIRARRHKEAARLRARIELRVNVVSEVR